MNTSEIKKLLKENSTFAKKAYGQHFLVDEGVLNDTIGAADLGPTDRVVEIGPGFGVLTDRLVRSAGEVIAIEADEFLASWLAKKVQSPKSKVQSEGSSGLGTEDLKLITGDALKVIDSLDFKEKYLKGSSRRLSPPQDDKEKEGGYKVVANIPYSITSKLIRLFLENEYPPKDMTLLIQKEVAERIVAKPGEMSLLSLSVQYYGEAKIVRKVPRSAFWPEPKVESAVIKIVCNQKSQVQRDGDVFRLARIGFSSRRKTLANNLSAGLRLERKKVTDIMKSNGLAETVRAQELAVEDWVELVKSL